MNDSYIIINHIEGHIHCKSDFYTAHTIVNSDESAAFLKGINIIPCEIDSKFWTFCYLLSMYNHVNKDIILFNEPMIIFDHKQVSLSHMNELSCYMDSSFPLFRSNKSINNLIQKGLKTSGMELSVSDIKHLFDLDDERSKRPLSQAGNEKYRAMAAIAYCNKKELFCFPWFSKSMYQYFYYHFKKICEVLNDKGKTIILPIGN